MQVKIKGLKNALEICLSGLLSIKGIPSVISQTSLVKPKTKALTFELLRSLIGHSLYTTDAIFMELMQNLNALIPLRRCEEYRQEGAELKQELTVSFESILM